LAVPVYMADANGGRELVKLKHASESRDRDLSELRVSLIPEGQGWEILIQLKFPASSGTVKSHP